MEEFAVQPLDRGAELAPPDLSLYWSRPETGGDEPTYAMPGDAQPDLVPDQFSWGCNGEPSTLSFTRQLGIGPTRSAAEHPDPDYMNTGTGYQARLTQWTVQEGTAVETELFRGVVGQIETLIQTQPDRELLRYTAYGPEQRLKHKTVEGAWYKTATADDLQIAGTLADATAIRSSVELSSTMSMNRSAADLTARLGF